MTHQKIVKFFGNIPYSLAHVLARFIIIFDIFDIIKDEENKNVQQQSICY
jgi:hypothetical protein